MPVILVNNAASIEVDISAALKYTINKGAFDVVLEYTGHPDDTGTVVIVLRSHAITERFIKLDWRDISSPVVASAEALRDLLLSWNVPLMIVQSSALPAGAASEAKQDLLLAELQLKADLTETQPVSAATLPLPDGAAKETKQDAEIALLTTLNSLAETLQDLNQRLMPLGSAMEAGNTRLRVVQTAVPSTAVTGPLTDAQNTAANLVMLKNMDTYTGDKAVQSNIVNVVT